MAVTEGFVLIQMVRSCSPSPDKRDGCVSRPGCPEVSEYFLSLTVPWRWAMWEHHLPMTPSATLMRSPSKTKPVLHWIIQPWGSQTLICADLDVPADSQEVVCSLLRAEMHSLPMIADTSSYSSIDLCSDKEEIKALCWCFSFHCSFWERLKWSLLVSPPCISLVLSVLPGMRPCFTPMLPPLGSLTSARIPSCLPQTTARPEQWYQPLLALFPTANSGRYHQEERFAMPIYTNSRRPHSHHCCCQSPLDHAGWRSLINWWPFCNQRLYKIHQGQCMLSWLLLGLTQCPDTISALSGHKPGCN